MEKDDEEIFVGFGWLVALGMAAPALAADIAARPTPRLPPWWPRSTIGLASTSVPTAAVARATSAGMSRTSSSTVEPIIGEGCHDATGGVVGGQIGYRWQSASWVFGLEAQGNWADLKGSNVSVFIPAWTNNSKIEAFGFFTGQVGYAWNNVLWYVKGGAA